jgi:hypothetical protein
MKDIHYSSKSSRSRKIQQSMHIYWNIVWDKVVTDKTYFEMTLTSKMIQLFKNISVTQKWFLMNISFEWSLTQMTDWIETLKTRNWTESQKYSLWSEKRCIVQNLNYALCFTSSDEKDAWLHHCWKRNWLKYHELTH